MTACGLHEFDRLGTVYKGEAVASMAQVREIAKQWNDPDEKDGSVTKEEKKYQKIEQELGSSIQTYEDSRELGALLETERNMVQVQTTQLRQLYS